MKIVLGADPEFALLDNANRRVSARHHLSGRQNFAGVDGYDVTGEIRPAPASNPKDLVRNIHLCLSLLWSTLHSSGIRPVAGAWQGGQALGGHIHLGGYLVEPPMRIITRNLLDKTLGVYFRAVSTKGDIGKRRVAGYGRLGCVRNQSHGLEYRTPPSWIISRTMAMSVAKLTYELFNACVQRPELHGQIRQFALSEPTIELLEEWTSNHYPKLREFGKVSVGFINQILGRRLPGNELLDLVANSRKWNDGENLFDTWGIDEDHLIPPEITYDETGNDYDRDNFIKDFLESQCSRFNSKRCSICGSYLSVHITESLRNICKCGVVICRYCQGNPRKDYRCPSCELNFYKKTVAIYD